jgi:glycosyltransferase involved in cell wall biosynthesis
LRVLHVAESTAGGLGVYLDAVVRAGRDRGFHVHVAVPPAAGVRERFGEVAAGLHPWPVTARPGPGLPGELWRLRRIIATVDPAVVHLHSSKAGFVGRLVLRGRRATVHQPHSWGFTAVTGRWADAALRWERTAARWTDIIVCVSRAEQETATRAGINANSVVVPNGVDLSRFTVADRASARKRLGLDSSPLAVCVGRLHRQKNQEALVDVWPAVRAGVPEARLALVGSGPDAETLAARRVPGVALVGEVADTRDWYAAADVVVQPSRWEGMSLAVLEALATGRSVVATRVTGMTEVVEVAALVPPDDGQALAAAVVTRLSHPALAAEEGLRGRQRVEAGHDLRTHLQVVLDVEEDLGARRRS